MNKIKNLLFVLLSLMLIMCSREQKHDTVRDSQSRETTETVVTDSAKAMCPYCGMVMEKAHMISYEVDGETQYFCSEMCKENHHKNNAQNKKQEM